MGCTIQKPAFGASYNVAYLIVRNGRAHTIGETFIKPCALQILDIICRKQQRKLAAKILLSNNVIHPRIADMSSDILMKVLMEQESSPFKFSTQLGEKTDMVQCCQHLLFT